MGTGIATLIAVCADKLHVNELIDAYAELIRSRAFWNTVNAFDFVVLTVCIVLVVVVVCTYQIKLQKK